MSINRVLISGNLTRDPELRHTQSGMAVLGFGVAVNDRRKNPQSGEWENYPNFIDCVMFGARAESLSRYLTKGIKASIEGKLRWSQWEQDGHKRSKIEVVVEELEFMSANQNATHTPQQPVYAPQPQQCAPQAYTPQQAPQMAPQPVQQGYVAQMPQYVQQQVQQAELYDEDIPF